MANPKIILADPDEQYLDSLQYKFAAEFFQKIDLEIITDRQYYNRYFSVPQKAEILVVSEELYDPVIQKHDIPNIFVLSERPADDQTGDLLTTTIYKYTNVNDIFNEIAAKSGDRLQISAASVNKPKLIVVTSAVGGVGKTTVSMGICSCLVKNFKRVLYVNAEYLQTFRHLLKNKTSISDSEIYSSISRSTKNSYTNLKHTIRSEAFDYLPPFKGATLSIGVDSGIYLNFANEAKESGAYDYVVVDTNSSFDEMKIHMLTAADQIVVVTKQDLFSTQATGTFMDAINNTDSDKFTFVCNCYDESRNNAFNHPQLNLKYGIDNYVEAFPDYREMAADKFVRSSGIKKTAMALL